MKLPVLIAVVVTLLVLLVGGATTNVGRWYTDLRKPRWNPPNWLFGPAWALILGLAAWAAVLAWLQARDPSQQWRIVLLFAANILFHMLWGPLFFNLRRPDWASIEVVFLWASVLALIIGLAPLSPAAAFLLLPYLLWVAFAAVLNFTIVRLNAPFGGRG
jgi:tryptophan-rich sensory protein